MNICYKTQLAYFTCLISLCSEILCHSSNILTVTRFHSPADWTVMMRRYFPGTMYSVSPNIVKMIPTCIVTNERVAWYGRYVYIS